MVNGVTLKRGNRKGRGKGRGAFFKSEPLLPQGTVGMLTVNGTELALPSDRSEVKIINFGGFVCSKTSSLLPNEGLLIGVVFPKLSY